MHAAQASGLVVLVAALCATPWSDGARAADDAEPPPPPAAETRAPAVPGTPSDVESVGWGGRAERVHHVEGAAPAAPLAVVAKPRPQGDWFVNRTLSIPRSLHPYVEGDQDPSITAHVFERLLDVDPDNPPNVAPALATSWEVGDDGRTVTYRLRRGVQFADGRPFTSADVKFTFDVVRDPAVNAPATRAAFERVAELTTPDEHTVVVRFKTRQWKGLYIVGTALRVLDRGWYQDAMPRAAERLGVAPFSAEPGSPGFAEVLHRMRDPGPGTGPYYLASERDFTGDSVHLVQNPFCWRTQVQPTRNNFAALHWSAVPDEPSAFHAFSRGELDLWVVPHDTWEDQLSRDPRIANVASHFVYDHIGLDASMIAWNCRKPPFDDANVRRAMTHLVDRDWVLRDMERGHGSVATCRSKRSYPTYSADLEPWPHDVAQARALLARGGWWKDQDGDGVVEKDGKPLAFELKIPAGRLYFRKIADQLAHACGHAGIRMTVKAVDLAQYVDDVNDRRFDAICYYGSWPDPWIDLYPLYHSSQAAPKLGNVAGWKHPRGDELLAAMQQELDDVKRTDMFREWNGIRHEEQPETLLVHPKVGVLVNKRFAGASIRPTGLQIFDLWVRPEDVLHR